MGNLKHIYDPGEFDRKVTIQVASGTGANLYGHSTSAWTDVVELWTKPVWKGRAGSGEDANQITEISDVSFHIRYRTGLTKKMRCEFEGNYFDIENIEEVPRKRFLILHCISFDSNNIGT